MTSRGPAVEGEVDDVTVAFLEAGVDDVTAAVVEAEVDDVSLSRAPVSKLSQSCLLSKVVGASPPLLTSGRGCGPCSSRTGYHLGSSSLNSK